MKLCDMWYWMAEWLCYVPVWVYDSAMHLPCYNSPNIIHSLFLSGWLKEDLSFVMWNENILKNLKVSRLLKYEE